MKPTLTAPPANSCRAAKAAGARFYYTGKPCLRGHICKRYTSNQSCALCRNDAAAQRYAAKYKNDPVFRARRIEYLRALKRDPEYAEQQRAAYREKYATDAAFVAHKKALTKQYRAKNLRALVARNAARHAAKKRRTPPWADMQEIRAFYENCPPGFHVDHVVPLQGKVVSGLHVQGNLQYLPAKENISKGNGYNAGMQ